MSEQKPADVTTEDWAQTPPAIREFVDGLIKRQKQDEPHWRYVPEKLRQNLGPRQGDETLQPGNGSVNGALLVVDDNEMNRDMLSRRLRRQGHLVEVAADGREALEKLLGAQKFDLVLLDIMMPEMNGYEVLEQMQNNSTMAHIPVIMITAVDEIESIVKCIQLGAEDYLPKPFNPVLLKARVDASLEKKRLRDQQEAYMHQLNLENERKSDELERARNIQRSMLPTAPPDLPFLSIAARQDTASEVGGDYYDFFHPTDEVLRIAVGDATGHGVASGLMVSMTKASLLSTNEADLLTLLQKINITLSEIDLGTQLNMALLLLDLCQQPDGRVTVWASGGGMPPIYILRANGQMEELIVAGLPLGIIAEAKYQSIEFSLSSGDTILLVSDGLPERFNDKHEFLGFDRLATAIERIDPSTVSANEILSQIATISDDWGQDYPPHDDTTLVVVKVK